MHRDISIIIVNWNTKDLLLKCIESVYKTIKAFSFEIIVVDNSSKDGSVETVRERFPDLIIVENRNNMGFAKANNQALNIIKGRYAVLLNTDTVLTEGAVDVMIDFMEKNRTIGICGGQLMNADGSRQNSIANAPSLMTELLNKSILRRLLPRRYPGKEQTFEKPIEVESVVGACMIVRKDAIDDTGVLDESFFFFLEETDWCMRMKKKGWKVFHHPHAKIFHLQGQTAGKVNFRARIEYWISRYLYFQKHHGKSTRIALRAGLLFKLLISISFLLLQNIVFLFSSQKAQDRLALNIRLLLWHLMGNPLHWGLRKSGTQ